MYDERPGVPAGQGRAHGDQDILLNEQRRSGRAPFEGVTQQLRVWTAHEYRRRRINDQCRVGGGAEPDPGDARKQQTARIQPTGNVRQRHQESRRVGRYGPGWTRTGCHR